MKERGVSQPGCAASMEEGVAWTFQHEGNLMKLTGGVHSLLSFFKTTVILHGSYREQL